MKLVYKITFPNGKIYVGKDLTGSVYYFGSPSNHGAAAIRADFTEEQLMDFTVRKEVLWKSEEATNKEVHTEEMKWIRQLQAHNPSVGYNRNPKWKG